MKIKNIKLKWYAIRYDMNTDKIEYFNVLSETITENIIKNIKNKKITTLKKLKSFIDNEFTYYYWCRSEYEIAVSNLFEEDFYIEPACGYPRFMIAKSIICKRTKPSAHGGILF